MSIVDFARKEGFEVRVKPTLGAYCEIHVIDNGRGAHEVSVIPELEVRGKSGNQLDEVVEKHLKALKNKIGSADEMHNLNRRASERREEYHRFWTNA